MLGRVIVDDILRDSWMRGRCGKYLGGLEGKRAWRDTATLEGMGW